MNIVKLLLLTLLPAVVLGCLVGIFVGKYKIKKESGQIRSILNTRQRILYSASILIGICCILFAIFYSPQQDTGDMGMDPGYYEPGMEPDMEPGMEGPDDEVGIFEGGAPLEEDALPEEPIDYEEPAADGAGDSADTAEEAPQPQPAPQPRVAVTKDAIAM